MPVSANQKTEEVLEVEAVEMLAELPALGVFSLQFPLWFVSTKM